MNFSNKFSNNTKSYLFISRFAFAILAICFVMVGISSCDEDLPGVGSIEDATPPAAEFSYTIDDVDYNIVTFSNSSISSTGFSWDFGDGGTSTEAEPVHTYTADGTYTVTLTASDANNATSVATQTVDIVSPPIPLSADFSYAAADATNFSTIDFTNLSLSADTYAWDFGDGTTSTDVNPQHIYDLITSSYVVELTASNSVTLETETTTRTVNVVDPNAALNANYSYEADATNTYEITFTNLSSGALTYLWDFGDGNTSTDENPVYTYAAPGTYTVILTAYDGGGGSLSSTQSITVLAPAPTFLPEVQEPGFEDNTLPDGSGDGRDSWRDPGEELGGVIQITTGPLVSGTQAAKLPSDNSRVGYQKITVEAYQNYKLRFNYTMKTDPVGTLTVGILSDDVDDPSLVSANMIESLTLSDQTDANSYIQETISFNSGNNTEVVIYFKNDGVECRLDDFSIEFD